MRQQITQKATVQRPKGSDGSTDSMHRQCLRDDWKLVASVRPYRHQKWHCTQGQSVGF